MAITADLKPDEIEAINKMIVDELTEQVLMGLEELGRECVNRTRDRSAEASWKDQTGNLRSSIGATIVSEGEEYERIPPQLYKQGHKGLATGNKLLTTEGKTHGAPYALVVIAGMDYAEPLQDYRKRDVLAGTKLFAESRLSLVLNDAIEAAQKRINAMMKK